MNDEMLGAYMKIVQPTCCTKTDLEALHRRKRWLISVVKMTTKGTTCQIVIHEDHLVLIIAISNERNKMVVAKLRQYLDLSLELVGPLLRTGF